jgi:hypothetical protein
MPIHDWTQVAACIFHDFHVCWISTIKRALNGGLLPPDCYALVARIAADTEPVGAERMSEGGVDLATNPPKVRFHARTEEDVYARKANAIVIRHTSDHEAIAMVELVSPGNKTSRAALASFASKAQQALQAGIHLLLVDLFPPTRRDPHGIHRVIWEGHEGSFALPDDAPLTCVSYMGGPCPEVFLEPVAVGNPLPEMPLFLTTETYVPVPLEATYQAAWKEVPPYWRDVLTAPVSR